MKLSNLWKLILKEDSRFKMIVCDKEHTLFHVDVDPTKALYRLPWECKTMDVERISIKESEVRVWVK